MIANKYEIEKKGETSSSGGRLKKRNEIIYFFGSLSGQRLMQAIGVRMMHGSTTSAGNCLQVGSLGQMRVLKASVSDVKDVVQRLLLRQKGGHKRVGP